MPLAVDFQGGVTSAWSNVITVVPKLAAALLIILAGYLIAKVVASVLNRVLERVGFDRAVERGGIRQALARSRYDASDIIAKLAFWLIFLVALQIAFGVFGPNPISDLLQGLIAYLPNVFVAIVIIVVAAAIAKAATDLLTNLARRSFRCHATMVFGLRDHRRWTPVRSNAEAKPQRAIRCVRPWPTLKRA